MKGGGHILLISPSFHGYWRSIANGFESIGYLVTTHCYDAHVGVAAKARNKIMYEGLDKIRPGSGGDRHRHAATAQARSVLRAVQPDVVVIVKGDLFDDEFWDELETSGLPRILWLYDEVRRTNFSLDTLARFPMVASYSPNDVATLGSVGIDATHVPLAFDPACQGPKRITNEVVFIGARYPNREALLAQLVQADVPVHAYGRDWSHAASDRLRTWSWSRPAIAASGQVSREAAAGIMAGACATLNLHGDQDGFTMRTFEAAGVGALQVIDRADVGLHYEPGVEVLVAQSADEVCETVAKARIDRAWAARVAQAGKARTLAEHTFVDRARILESLWA